LIRRVIARLVVHILRVLEFLLPVWCLSVLFGPAAAVVAGWQLFLRSQQRAKPTIRQFDRLPVSWWPPRSRSVRIWQIWRHWTRVNVTKLLTFWPDRLTNHRWQPRGRSTDLDALERLAAQGRPVILAILHYGPVTVLHYWLRAQGFAVASLVANAADHLSLSRRNK
jgi:lauroyl/myristoyl acyltransferase